MKYRRAIDRTCRARIWGESRNCGQPARRVRYGETSAYLCAEHADRADRPDPA